MPSSSRCRLLFWPAPGWVLLLSLPAQASPPSLEANTFFEERIRPLLVRRCLPCHGPQKQRSGLRLDSPAALRRGGEHGPALDPAKPDGSLLLRVIGPGEPFAMPPRDKLPERERADLAAWVRMGAPWPDSTGSVRPGPEDRRDKPGGSPERDFWAFRKPVEPPLPPVRNRAWVQTPLDQFVLAGLEVHGLEPAPPADRRTLLRRVTYDLIGLPPTPKELAAFLADDRPYAFARVVERLLASPRYGERWGRHFLDVARYADSNGMDENLAFANAWRYRDYVIDAFNRDKPYDQFVVEQLAGDLLPPDPDPAVNSRRLIATGFLCLGPKMLAEDDPVKMEMDIIDEQVDTVGRAFLGLTLGCARCHDHKFDPIPTADYYSLAGIFKSTKTMENFTVVARWQERPIASAAGQQRQAAQEKTAPPDAAMAVAEGKVGNLRIHLRGNHLTLGPEVPRRFPRILAGEQQTPLDGGQSGRLQLARWLTRPEHPLTARVLVNRLWRWHFGTGLVRSADNFGQLGERPDNQALLDYLAVRFVRDGWSIKTLHRLIVLSSTYQMSGRAGDKVLRADPENRLSGRRERRRLEAEAVRDALLAVSGRLDVTVGGSLLQTKNRGYVASTFSVNPTNYASNRRSVYLPVIRSALYEVFQAFDFADPSVPNGERATTTVAPQALFMMNSPLVQTAARDFAALLLARKDLEEAGRVRLAYEQAYGRPAEPHEIERALTFVRQRERMLAAEMVPFIERRLRAWQGLCRVILAANEFVYVE